MLKGFGAGRQRELSLCLMMSSGIMINYLDRVNISHALPTITDEFRLTASEQGFVLSAFSLGYVGVMLLAGVLVDRLGAFRTAGLAAGAWSVATAASGVVLDTSALIVSRVAVGASEAPIFPANARLVREVIVAERRGFAIALFDAGSYLGAAISAPIVVAVIVLAGWRVSFFVCALIGLLWVAAWFGLGPRLVESSLHTKNQVSWSDRTGGVSLLRQRRVWGASVGFFAYNYSKNFYLTWLPVYLMRDRGLTLPQIGVLGAVPPLFAICGDLWGGWWTDHLLKTRGSLTLARKVPILVGLVLGASMSVVPCVLGDGWAVLLLCVAFGWNSSAAPAIWALPGDFSREGRWVGTLAGIQNTVANLAGIVAPLVTGALVAWTGSFDMALAAYGAVAVLGAVGCHVLLTSVEPLTT